MKQEEVIALVGAHKQKVAEFILANETQFMGFLGKDYAEKKQAELDQAREVVAKLEVKVSAIAIKEVIK